MSNDDSVAVEIVFETHAISEDNEIGVASGWLGGRLSPRGRQLARALGKRRRDDGLAAVFTSDLARATETARLAFGSTDIPVLADWRLRECDYGELNGAPAHNVHALRRTHLPAMTGDRRKPRCDHCARSCLRGRFAA